MTEQSPLSFPDHPRSELDRALEELVERAGEVMHTQGRLRALLRATQAVVEPIELPMVLERIVHAAVELVDAEYGALGVVAAEGGLEEFIHVGMPPETVAAIGHLPEGRGVLGALIDDPRPIRLQHIGDDPRSVGFPPGHPPMDGFLGVPIRVRDEVFGNLYLANPRAAEFTAEDEQLVTALAATAGFAIANARLFDETRMRQLWTASSAQIASSLLDTASGSALPMLADELIARTTAERICIVLPGPRPFTVTVAEARGDGADAACGGRDPRDAHGGGHRARERRVPVAPGWSSRRPRGCPRDHRRGRRRAVDVRRVDEHAAGMGGARRRPIAGSTPLHGLRTRHRRRPGRARRPRDRAGEGPRGSPARPAGRGSLAHRPRPPRPRHPAVVRRRDSRCRPSPARSRTTGRPDGSSSAITTLDESIAQIRTIIFAMRPHDEADGSVRHRVLEIAAQCSASLPQPVAVGFTRPARPPRHGRARRRRHGGGARTAHERGEARRGRRRAAHGRGGGRGGPRRRRGRRRRHPRRRSPQRTGQPAGPRRAPWRHPPRRLGAGAHDRRVERARRVRDGVDR